MTLLTPHRIWWVATWALGMMPALKWYIANLRRERGREDTA